MSLVNHNEVHMFKALRDGIHPFPTTTMSLADSSKQERMEDFFTKFLLGEELINTQFHLFSARSAPSSRLTSVLCANNVLLVKSSKYFLDRM